MARAPQRSTTISALRHSSISRYLCVSRVTNQRAQAVSRCKFVCVCVIHVSRVCARRYMHVWCRRCCCARAHPVPHLTRAISHRACPPHMPTHHHQRHARQVKCCPRRMPFVCTCNDLGQFAFQSQRPCCCTSVAARSTIRELLARVAYIAQYVQRASAFPRRFPERRR